MLCLVRVQVTYLHGTGIENIETVMNFYILRKDIWVGRYIVQKEAIFSYFV